MRGRQILARLRPQMAALFEQRAAFSSSTEAKPLTWVFLGPPVSYDYINNQSQLHACLLEMLVILA